MFKLINKEAIKNIEIITIILIQILIDAAFYALNFICPNLQ